MYPSTICTVPYQVCTRLWTVRSFLVIYGSMTIQVLAYGFSHPNCASARAVFMVFSLFSFVFFAHLFSSCYSVSEPISESNHIRQTFLVVSKRTSSSSSSSLLLRVLPLPIHTLRETMLTVILHTCQVRLMLYSPRQGLPQGSTSSTAA